MFKACLMARNAFFFFILWRVFKFSTMITHDPKIIQNVSANAWHIGVIDQGQIYLKTGVWITI